MSSLIQIVYCSAATRPFDRSAFAQLLSKARENNEQVGVTGMLLYADGSFFQVLEGPPAVVDALFERIRADARHDRLTIIIREVIAQRAFADWTMGFAHLSAPDLDGLLGVNDAFDRGASLDRLGPGRARKLISAFVEGRWRSALHGAARPETRRADPGGLPAFPRHTFAFQPILDATNGTVFCHEALIRGPAGEPARDVLARVPPAASQRFDQVSHIAAVELAARLGLATRVSLNFLPLGLQDSPEAITSVVAAARRCGLRPDQIVVEILEREIIRDRAAFLASVDGHRGDGVVFAIDDFGAGYAGLNLLADFQPEVVKLDMDLIRGIDSNGPRQAIVRGIVRTCLDLGIDVVAEGVETPEEYAWLREEGLALFQGNLIARPAFEELASTFFLPTLASAPS